MDQSGSMADSVVYGAMCGSIFASLPALDTRVVPFDTDVVDLTEKCGDDPVDMLFGVQLGGGTDINKSVAYCEQFISEPGRTLLILVTDLFAGGQRLAARPAPGRPGGLGRPRDLPARPVRRRRPVLRRPPGPPPGVPGHPLLRLHAAKASRTAGRRPARPRPPRPGQPADPKQVAGPGRGPSTKRKLRVTLPRHALLVYGCTSNHSCGAI